MKKAIIASLAIIALGGSAMAADMGLPPVYKAPPPAPSWTGCYVNAGGGYGMWNSKIHEETTPPAPIIPLTSDTNVGGEGWLGVAGGGCDYQFRAFNTWDVVIGAFGDFDLADLHGIATDPSGFGGDTTVRSAWAGGLRAGVLITPTLLAYINGGYTGAHVGQTNLALQIAVPPAPLGFDIAAHNFNGWFLGGGTEYALNWSWLPIAGLFWRNEYRFSTYQSADLPEVLTAVGLPIGTGIHAANNDVQTITSSLVWRFNWIGH